jgi:alpha-1,6-mannosyltransferase
VIARGLAGSLLVLLGGLVVSTLPPSTPLLQYDLLIHVRQAEAGRMAGLAIVLLGLGLVAHAWLSLCRQVAVTHPRDHVESLGLVRFATVVWSAPLLLAPPLFSRDGWSYAAQGAMSSVGISPYEHGPAVLDGPIVQAVDPMWMHTATPYGPLPLWFGETMAVHTGNPWVLVIGHRVVALVGLVLLAWAMPRLAAWSQVNPALATAVVVASPLMLANGVGGLHNDLLMAGLMAAALVVAAEYGWAAGAVLGACAAAVKVPGGLVCIGVALISLAPHAGLTERARRLAGVGAVAVATLLGLGVLAGTGAGWLHALTVPGVVNTPLSATTLVGGAMDWTAATLGLGLAPATFLDLMRHLGLVVTFGVAVWVAVRWDTGNRSRSVLAVGVVLGATVVLGPVVHLWYFLWPLPFLAALALSRLAMSGLLVGSVVIGLVAPLDTSLHGAYTAVVLGGMIIAMLLPLLLMTRDARARIERIAAPAWLSTRPGRTAPAVQT